MEKKEKSQTQEWDEAEIKTLPFNLIKVLEIFIKEEKKFLDSPDIKKELKLADKQVGAIMSAFRKVAKGRRPLVYSVFRVGRGNRWIIEPRYLNIVRKVISKLEPYLK